MTIPPRDGEAPVLPEPATVWEVAGEEDVAALAGAILSPSRQRPLLLVTCPSDTQHPRVNLDHLGRRTGSAVEIAVVRSPRDCYALSDRLGHNLRTYGGAIRLLWPGAQVADDFTRHRLFLTPEDRLGSYTVTAVVEELQRRGYVEADPPRRTPAPEAVGRVPDQRVPRADVPAALAHPADQELERRLARDNTDLRRRVRSLTDQVEELQRRLYQRDIFTDPERQLRHEIHTSWLVGYTEADREDYPLRDYVIGQDFLASLQDLETLARHLVIEVCVDVLTRRAREQHARAVHPYRAAAAPGAAQLVRADGATAWRCSVQQNAPAARRLMWWECPDGTAELMRVAVHDRH